MQSKQLKIYMNVSITDQPNQRPEQSLKIISNYSSLERMYQKSRQSKIYPHLAIRRRDSFNIAGWQHLPIKDKQTKGFSNREKFNRSLLPSNTLILKETIGSQRVSHCKSSARSRLSPANQKIIQTTNFKFRKIKAKNQQKRYRTLSFDSQNRFQKEYLKQKKQILRFYEGQAMKRKGLRQNYRPNLQFCLPLTQYPVMNDLKSQKGCRKLRKQQFLLKHLS